jgi:hypothetical protein
MPRRLWTRDEDDALRSLVGTCSYARIGDAIGRSASSVHGRARILGLHNNWRRGDNHPSAKLTSLKAAMIGTLLDAGFTAHEVRDAMGLDVSLQTIGDIGRGTTWR